MEKLTVYEDYVHSMMFLHASRNRMLNAAETSRVSPEDARYLTDSCTRLYKAHTQLGCDRLEQVQLAIRNRQATELQEAMRALHRHNRQTMRLSKVFEEDIADSHPDPDAPVDDDAPKVEADLSVYLPSTKLRAKIKNLLDGMQS
jgi:hypothetical protein